MRDANTEHLDAPGIRSPGKLHSTDLFCTKVTGKKYEKPRKFTSSCINNLGTTANLAQQPHTSSWHCIAGTAAQSARTERFAGFLCTWEVTAANADPKMRNLLCRMTNRGTQGRAGSQQGGSGQQGEHAAVQNDSSLPQAAVHIGSCAQRPDCGMATAWGRRLSCHEH